jgi:hypothetical protein
MRIKAIVIIAVLFGTVFIIGGSAQTGFANKAFAADTAISTSSADDVKTTTTNNNITLGNPFYIEYDKITSQRPVVIQGGLHAIGVTFSGNGTVKGMSFTQIGGRALIIPISKDTADIIGNGVITANDGNGNSTFGFREISHANAADGTMRGSGATIFNANATGKMAFLSNTVAIFKEVQNKDGSAVIRAWEWK